VILGCTTGPPISAASAVGLERVLAQEPLDRPLYVTPIPDGSGALAVVEQPGRVLRFRPGAGRAERVLIDIRRHVSTEGWEEGLLSIAFHPRFAENATAFIYYSAAGPRRSVLARVRLPARGTVTDVAGMTTVLEVLQPYRNHNGGLLLFGPDGHLYVGLGDGGSAGDPMGHGQNRGTLLGSILRIDVDRTEGGRPYAVPPDNPFVDDREARPEIWAYGLRNPWRFSFDRATGELYAGDVGQNELEEVDRIVRGGNYGWNVMEGAQCYPPGRTCESEALVYPIAQYGHDQGKSITGGYVYRGSTLPWLRGRYVFGDFMSGTLWTIAAAGDGLRSMQLLGETSLSLSSFGEDARGELYLTDLRGGVYRMVPPRGP